MYPGYHGRVVRYPYHPWYPYRQGRYPSPAPLPFSFRRLKTSSLSEPFPGGKGSLSFSQQAGFSLKPAPVLGASRWRGGLCPPPPPYWVSHEPPLPGFPSLSRLAPEGAAGTAPPLPAAGGRTVQQAAPWKQDGGTSSSLGRTGQQAVPWKDVKRAPGALFPQRRGGALPLPFTPPPIVGAASCSSSTGCSRGLHVPSRHSSSVPWARP